MAASTATCQNWTWPLQTSTASTSAWSFIASWLMSNTRFFANRSLSAPPTGDRRRIGVNCSALTTPSWSGDCVISSTSHACATLCIHVPICEISWPAQKSRKSRCRRAPRRAPRGACSPAPRVPSGPPGIAPDSTRADFARTTRNAHSPAIVTCSDPASRTGEDPMDRAPRAVALVTAIVAAIAVAACTHFAAADEGRIKASNPQVVVISLDGAKSDLVQSYLATGVLDKKTGLGRLKAHGVVAEQNITVTPSVTAVAHIAIATGSTAAHNDIPLNTFHPVAASIGTSISGFAAPIGGYQLNPLGPSPAPTAEPLWVQLRRAGKKVVTATWPGSDGADISISNAPPGAPPVSTLVQAATPIRTTDYTVPFGAFGGLGAQGFALTSASFAAADATLTSQLVAAGHVSHSPVRVTAAPVETVFCAPATTATCGTTNASGRTLRYDIKVAALDTTDDHVVNYDTLVFFEATAGVQPGPFALPSSGPAYVKLGGPSAKFFFEGSGNKIGAAYFVSFLVPDLSTVRIARYEI